MYGDAVTCDLAVIGAGIYGIQAVRTYLELHPLADVILFEKSSSIGGVWSKDRVYDDFWTQTPISMARFSDRAIGDIDPSDNLYGYFPAKYVTEYLEEYAKSHIYNGTSLASRVRPNTPVIGLSKVAGGWLLDLGVGLGNCSAARVIDASGQTSHPLIPSVPRLPTFKGQVQHQIDFAQCNILSNAQCKTIVVVGGAKSAADIAYACSKNSNKTVHWIIRRSGCGPAALLGPNFPGYRNSTEAVSTRVFSRFIATIHNGQSHSWLYKSSVGRHIFWKVWAIIHKAVVSAPKYDRANGGDRGFFNLKPDTSIFWSENSPGLAIQPDFIQTIAKNVTVHRQDIVEVSENHVNLENGLLLEADAIIFATGWKNNHAYLSTEAKLSLGLPVATDESNRPADIQSALSDDCTAQQDWKVLSHLLSSNDERKHSSRACLEPGRDSSYKLWKYIMPLTEPSILFLGAINAGNNFIMAEVQALWAVALFDGHVEVPPQNELKSEVNAVLSWTKHRYLRKGSSGIWLYFDTVPYADSLLKQIGLESHLKKAGGFISQLFRPVKASHYSDLLQEYRIKYDYPRS